MKERAGVGKAKYSNFKVNLFRFVGKISRIVTNIVSSPSLKVP